MAFLSNAIAWRGAAAILQRPQRATMCVCMDEMDDILAIAGAWRQAGEAVALATVVKTWGSSPRPCGSQLAVTRSGRMAGSVSGGCIEGAVAEAALATLQTGRPEMLSFGITNERAWEVGLACGGQVSVFVEPILP